MREESANSIPGRTSRRSMLGAGALLFGLALSEEACSRAKTVEPLKPETKDLTSLHQEVEFASTPAHVYAALIDSTSFAAFSGYPATIDPKEGGAFALFGGRVVGRNIELIPGQRIVQAWRVVADFGPGVYSLVRIELVQRGTGTLLKLDHTGFPPGHFDHLNAGWGPRYWLPLKKFLA